MPRKKKPVVKKTGNAVEASIAALVEMLGEDDKQIRRIAAKAGIVSSGKGMYPRNPTILAVKEYYKKQAAEVTEGRKSDLDRKARNEADMSDIELADKMGKLMLKSDAKTLWQDALVEMRRQIQTSKTLPEKAKAEVVTMLQSIKLNEERVA